MHKGLRLMIIALIMALALICCVPGFGAASDVKAPMLAPPGSARKDEPDPCRRRFMEQGTGPPDSVVVSMTADPCTMYNRENMLCARTELVLTPPDYVTDHITQIPGPPGSALT